MIDINSEFKGLTIDNVVGPLQNKLRAIKEVPRVVLFSGDYGCGKNLGAYLLAQKLGEVEITVRNTTDNTAKGAEVMISQFAAPPLLPSLNQVCVLNEFTLLRKDGQAKFKDILDVPPERSYFFICTNEPEKIIADIYNRFRLVIEVGLLNNGDAYQLVHETCERLDVELNKKKKLAIAKKSDGRPRTIINTIRAIKSAGSDNEDFINEQLKEHSSNESHEQFMLLYFALINQQRLSPKQLIYLMESTGLDPTSIRFKLLGMIYNNFDYKAKQLYASLIEPLEERIEKHDLLCRFMRLLKMI